MDKAKYSPMHLNDAQRRRVVDNLALIRYLLAKHGYFGLEADDAFQTGVIGLMRAAATYESGKSAFSTYAANCVLNQLRRALRTGRAVRRGAGVAALPLDAPISADADTTYLDLLPAGGPDVADQVADMDAIQRALRALDDMPARNAAIAKAYLLTNITQAQIARDYGVSQSQVSRCVSAAARHMQAAREA